MPKSPFGADVAGVAFRTIFAFGASYVFIHLMTIHLKRGNSIPAKALGNVPADFASSCYFSYLLRFSGPTIILALILAVGDFSHSIADLGLSFVTFYKEGPVEPVLNLDIRNPMRLFELSGDPTSSFRAYAFPDSKIASAVILRQTGTTNRTQSRRDERLIQSFLVASDNIAGGISPFANYTEGEPVLIDELDYHSVEVSVRAGVEKPLSRIGMKLPLHCKTSSMVAISQTINSPDVPGADDYYERVPVKNDAAVPDCDYNDRRSSGIFVGQEEQAEILEHMSTYFPADNLTLAQGEKLGKTVTFTPGDKALAIDRDDWKQGRKVSKIRGLVFGDLVIPFGTTVLATAEYGLQQQQNFGNRNINLFQERYYFLVSNVVGKCSPLPSGRQIERIECMVFTGIECDPVFIEDIEAAIPSDFKDPDDLYLICLKTLP